MGSLNSICNSARGSHKFRGSRNYDGNIFERWASYSAFYTVRACVLSPFGRV